MATMRLFFIVVIAALSGCAEIGASLAASPQSTATIRPNNLVKTEFAMSPGEVIVAITSIGTIQIRAVDWLQRSYSWEGATRTVTMSPRNERWYGSLGIYYPGPGRHWKEHNGITRCVVDEGLQHFDSVEAVVEWLAKPEQQCMPFVYRNDGLMVGWSKIFKREQLTVTVWQIMINGKKPTSLPDAKDDAICVTLP